MDAVRPDRFTDKRADARQKYLLIVGLQHFAASTMAPFQCYSRGEDALELVEITWFLQEVPRSMFPGLNRARNCAVSGLNNNSEVLVLALSVNPLQHLVTPHVRH